jgi:transcriptional regulator with XRE-family HTH domain
MRLRLKEVRRAQGMTLKQAEERLERLGNMKSYATISRYENGLIPITMPLLVQFATAYGVSVHDLFAEDDRQEPV